MRCLLNYKGGDTKEGGGMESEALKEEPLVLYEYKEYRIDDPGLDSSFILWLVFQLTCVSDFWWEFGITLRYYKNRNVNLEKIN